MVNPMELFTASPILLAGVGTIPMKKGYSMKLFLISAAAVALALASPALAQDHHDKGHNKGDHNRGTQSAPQAAPAAKPVVPPHQKITPGNTTTQAPAAAYQKALRDATARNQRERQNNNRATNTNRPDTNRATINRRDNNRPDNSARSNDRRDNNARGNDRRDNSARGDNRRDNSSNWNNNRRDNRGSWQGRFNRRNVEARHHYRYRGDAWRWPSGHSYRRWTFGMTLPSLFWGSNYWISDYSYYGLAYPPPGTVWVRYGNDAILIDRYTGEILEVVYGQFY
jgi:Ni/Co efflux regulator RcnB